MGTGSDCKDHMIIGTQVDYGVCRGYVRCNSLPALGKGDVVVNADLYLLEANLQAKGNCFYGSVESRKIYAYMITSSWAENTLCGNSMPSSTDTCVDFITIKPTDTDGWRNWDITRYAQMWYTGTANNGIMLASEEEDSKLLAHGIFASSATATPEGSRPYFVITYRNANGLEDYWTYHTNGAGRAGTGAINDHTGNLVFTNTDAATNGSIMPVTITHVYNNYRAGLNYSNGRPYVGHGWKLSIQQSVKSTSDRFAGQDAQVKELFPYVYEDGDGTEHYFYKDKKNNKLVDEDGLGYTLEKISSGFRISDEKGNKMEFNSAGNLIKIIDANGNFMTITYNGNIITKVTDGVGRETILTSTDAGFLTKITDPAGRETLFSYSDAKLMTVTQPDGNVNHYEYDSGRSLIKAYDDTGYGIEYTYSSSFQGKRVVTVKEKTGMGTANVVNGQQMNIDYTKYFTTVFTTPGKDDIIGTADDIKTTYQFDNYGRTVSMYSMCGDKSLGGRTYKYTEDNVQNNANRFKSVNKIESEAPMYESVTNLVRNGDGHFEVTWNHTASGAISCNANYDRTVMHNGNNSFRVTSTSTGEGYAGWYQVIPSAKCVAGKTYTLSAYVKVNSMSINENSEGGAYVNAQVTAGGAVQNNYSEFITDVTDTALNDGWKRIKTTFTIPQSGFTELKIWLGVKNATSQVWFDSVQLEEGSEANPFNFLENGAFEASPPNYGWDIGTGEVQANKGRSGSKGFYYPGSYAEEAAKKLPNTYQRLANAKESDTYVISGWAKGCAQEESSPYNPKFEIQVKISYTDGSTTTKTLKFNSYVTDWQYGSMAFDLSDGTDAEKTPNFMRLSLAYINLNTAYFDDLQLVKDDVPSYVYDDDGKMISVRESSKQKSTMEYTNSDLTKTVDAKGYAYTYTYDDNHNMTQAKSQNEVETNYAYNEKGIATSMNVKSKDGSLKMTSSAEYYQDGNYVKSVTDANGNQDYYDYDLTKGLLKSYTNNGETLHYSYNSDNDRLEKVVMDTENGLVWNGYEYEDNMLSEIKHNGFTYGFEYDGFGNTTATKVGSRTLMSHEYNANNGKVKRSTYGNGVYFENEYDALDRVTATKYNGETLFKWTYDNSGNTSGHEDLVNNTRYEYEYDTTGRPARRVMFDRTTGERIHESGWEYDLNNNVVKDVHILKGTSLVTEYEYGKDNLLTKTVLPTGANIENTFDGLNRMTERKLNITDSVNKSTTYAYKTPDASVDGSNTTTQIASETTDDITTSYEYDVVGNITKIYENNALMYAYEYDALSQLTLECDIERGTETHYTYDSGGNITNKLVIDAETFEILDDINYGYDDAEWGDLLTSYDGESITYDEIGNPLSYRGYTMTWERGRKLATLSGNGVTASYKYDSDGLRTQKTVNNITSKYYYDGTQLLLEERGTDKLYFYYDGSGLPISVKLNDTVYYYRTNSRGDITGLYDTSGTLVCEYTYDSWGKLLSVTGANNNAITDADHIANVNPLRYRGYYYDSETQLYYLQSRYYDPELCRFISADNLVASGSDLTGKNLFSYCGNNPINREDSSGHFWLAALIVTVVVAVVAAVGYKHVSKSNYKKNSKVDKKPSTTTKNKIINDQNGATGNNFSYGFHSASHNACETIAVHNAKVLKGVDSTLSDTMRDCQSSGAMIGYGYFGTNPLALGDVLEKSGLDYSRVGKKDLVNPGVYILSFWNKGAPWNGLHTVAMSYDGVKYTTYNLEGDGRPSDSNPLDYIGSRYICGYYLGE